MTVARMEAPTQELQWAVEDRGRWSALRSVADPGDVGALLHEVIYEGQTLLLQHAHRDAHAQAVRQEDGSLLVEIVERGPNATMTWRVGVGEMAMMAGNVPGMSPRRVQRLADHQAAEVLVSWSLGQGLPVGYGGALHVSR